MLRLIAFLFTGCWHQWEDVDQKLVSIYETQYRSADTLPKRREVVILQRCKNCGKYRQWKFNR